MVHVCFGGGGGEVGSLKHVCQRFIFRVTRHHSHVAPQAALGKYTTQVNASFTCLGSASLEQPSVLYTTYRDGRDLGKY